MPQEERFLYDVVLAELGMSDSGGWEFFTEYFMVIYSTFRAAVKMQGFCHNIVATVGCGFSLFFSLFFSPNGYFLLSLLQTLHVAVEFDVIVDRINIKEATQYFLLLFKI